jgi:hypothetical protein
MQKTQAELLPLSAMSKTDKEKFADWMWEARQLTRFDPDVLTYPRIVMAKTTKGDETTSYTPIQPVLMAESFAPSLTANVGTKAAALYEIQELLVRTMQTTGMGESYFLAEDSLAEFALSHGWEEIKDVRILRRKLRKEERKAWEPTKDVACV